MSARQTLVLNRVVDGMDCKLTNPKGAAIGKCSADTALQDINDLLTCGVLRPGRAKHGLQLGQMAWLPVCFQRRTPADT